MMYEINEVRFFKVSGISQVKTYTSRISQSNDNTLTIEINLNYYNQELEECYQQLFLPIETNILIEEDNFLLKNVALEVIENQGVNVTFEVEVTILDTVSIKEEIESSYQEALEENFKRTDEDVLCDDVEEEQEVYYDEKEQEVDDLFLVLDDNSKQAEKEEISENIKLGFLNLESKYHTIRLINCDKEEEFDRLSKDYNLSLSELYEAKKKGGKFFRSVK